MHNEKNSLVERLSFFTKISEDKLSDYLRGNSLQTLINHPETITPTLNQLENINKLKDLSRFYKRLTKFTEYQFDNSREMADFLETQYPNKYDKERFIVAYLDRGNKLLGCDVVFSGTLDSAIIHPRDIMKRALKYKSDRLVLSHNHPSGNPSPSNQDVEVTARLKNVAEMLDLKILDHIIVGKNKYYSFKENHLLDTEYCLETTKSFNNKKLYSEDTKKMVNLISEFTNIPKIKLNHILKDADFKTFFSNPQEFINDDFQLDKLEKLKYLSNKYKEVSQREIKTTITSPDKVVEYMRNNYPHLDERDCNIVAFLNSKNEVIESAVIPDDITDKEECKYIFEKAILHDSKSIILASKIKGEITLENKEKDRVATIKNKSRIVGIEMLDNVVINKDRSISYLEHNILENREIYKCASKNKRISNKRKRNDELER